MSNDAKFINGLIVKAPNENAPEYIKAKLSIKREELIAWLQSESGEWINADVKVSHGGKWYAAVDDWKPNQGGGSGGSRGGAPQRESRAPVKSSSDDFVDSDIPFISQRGPF